MGALRIVVFDEAHNLTLKQSDALLRALEQQQASFVIILLTTKIDALDQALRARVSEQRFVSLSKDDLVAHGKRVCAGESIKYDDAAIDLLAKYSNGLVRNFLQKLDDVVAGTGELTGQRVREKLGANLHIAASTVVSMLNGDLAQAAAMSSRADHAAPHTVDLIRRLLTGIEYRLRRIVVDDDGLRAIAPSVLDELLEAGRRVAERQHVDQLQIWAELREIWSKASVQSRNDLSSIHLDCHSWLHERPPTSARLRRIDPRAPVIFKREASRIRPHRRTTGSGSDHDNSLEQAKRVLDSASLMSQVYGVYLNSRIAVRPGRFGFNDDAAAQVFVGYLIRSLVGRIHEWCGRDTPVHWIYTQTGVGVRSVYTAAFALPTDVLEAAEDWLFGKFLPAQFNDPPTGGISFRWAAPRSVAAQALYQARILRLLCRGISTTVDVWVGGKRRLLIDAIGIPRRLRCPDAGSGLVASRVSKTIGRSEAKKWKDNGLPVLTPGHDGAWDYRNPGWELAEHADRNIELDRRERGSTLPQTLRVLADGPRSRQLLKGSVVRTSDARSRFRTWPTAAVPGWWQPCFVPRLARFC